MPEQGAPVRLAMWLGCGHLLTGRDLVNRTTYHDDDDRLLVSCSWAGCGYVQPARGNPEVLAELHCQVTLRDAREALAVPRHPVRPVAPSLLEDIEQAGSLWEVRKVLDREPLPYAGRIETGTRAHATTPYLEPRTAEDTAVGSGPWLLRLDLWWMRLCLRWQTGDGVHLDIRVPTVSVP